MENKTSQNDWFAELHTQHLKKEEVVEQTKTKVKETKKEVETVIEDTKEEVAPKIVVEDEPDHIIKHVVTESDIKENPEFISEGINVGDQIKIDVSPVTPVKKVVVRKKKAKK